MSYHEYHELEPILKNNYPEISPQEIQEVRKLFTSGEFLLLRIAFQNLKNFGGPERPLQDAQREASIRSISRRIGAIEERGYSGPVVSMTLHSLGMMMPPPATQEAA